MKIGHAIANFFSGLWNDDLKPWLKDLLKTVEHDVVDALVPLAHEAIQEVLNDGGKILAGASISDVASGAGAALVNIAKKAEAAGMQAAGHDLLTALAGALSTRTVQDAGTAAS